MKNVFFVLLFANTASLYDQTAEIKIDVDRSISEIDPKIYDKYAPFGQNMMSTLAVAQYLNSFVRHAESLRWQTTH